MTIGRYRRALRALVAGAVLATTFMTGSTGATAGVLASDDFEPGSATTFETGTSRDCTRGYQSSCSVRVQPSCCSNRVRATSQVGKPITSATTVSFQFMAASTFGDLDSYVQVVTDKGVVIMDTTEGYNNGLNLSVEGVGEKRGFAYWNATNTWLPLSFKFDPATHKVTATGAGGSWTMGMPPGAARIERVEFWGVNWGGGTGFWYDALRVEDSAPPPNVPPTATLVSPGPGIHLPYRGPYNFTVRADDPDDATYTARVQVRAVSNGAIVQDLTTSGQSGTNAQVTFDGLIPGDYDWWASATDARGLSSGTTPPRRFTVDHMPFTEGVYVALGDSYASGEGAPAVASGGPNAFEPGTNQSDNECHRSSRSYPRLISGAAGMPREMVFGACSGAVTRNLWREPQYNEPVQFDYIDPDRTALVTMSIGGNDAGFSGILKACINPVDWYCADDQQGRLDAGLARLDAEIGAAPAPGMADVQPLSQVYQMLRGRAPHAKVVIVGYPKFFPDGGHRGFDGRPLGCEGITHPDQLWMNTAVERINDIIQRRAEERGFVFADVENALAGHHLCSADPWMNGIQVSDPVYYFHPDTDGHAAEATIVHAAATGTAGQSFRITPNQTIRFPRIVFPKVYRFNVWSAWGGSDVVLTLRSPSGRVITRDTVAPDVERQTGPTYEVVNVTNPEPGEWEIELFGADVPESGEPVEVGSTTHEAPNQYPTAVIEHAASGVNTISVDGSGSSDPDGTIASYEWIWGDGTSSTGATASHRYAAPGNYDVVLVVRDDDGAVALASTGVVAVTGYSFTGFGSPVNPAPTLNRVNAGRAVPLKWRITDAAGAPVADPASFAQVTSVQVPCDASAPVDLIEEVATTNSGLRYDGDGYWQYNWTTDKAWAGTCRRMTLRLDDGGTASRSATFDFR